MLRLGAAQVKQVAHRAPNENPSRAPAMPDATPQVVYMTCRAFMRRSADLTRGRRASLRSSDRTCARRGRCHRFVDPGFRPCSLHRITFCFRGALRLPRRVLVFAPHPARGVDGAPTGALVFHVARARRDDPRERYAGRPVATGTPSRRSTVAIFGRGPTRRLRQWDTGADQRLACARPYGPAGGITDLPRQRFAPPPQDATPCSACRIVSGDAPHERGCESI
jgi:hypothetical protein